MENQESMLVNDEQNSVIKTPSTLVGIIAQMTAYVPQEEVEEIVIEQEEKRGRGRPKKLKQVDGRYKHRFSERDKDGAMLTLQEKLYISNELRLWQEQGASLKEAIERAAAKYKMPYRQAYELLVDD